MSRMKPSRRSEGGFTLIEMTVVLAVIVTLALVMTPSIANTINDSRAARAKQDCQTIASAITQFYRDNAFFPQWTTMSGTQAATIRSQSNLLTLLSGPGNVPATTSLAGAGITDQSDLAGWTLTANVGSLADQLMTDAVGYPLKAGNAEFGWNGPYLSSPIGSDPWNNRYMVNIGAADNAAGVQATDGGVKKAVWVLSAGSNGVIETPFSQSVLTAVVGGDDIAVRIQ
jgi:prepilin-type N-terminal cleavage/methylation domain-containing protein